MMRFLVLFLPFLNLYAQDVGGVANEVSNTQENSYWQNLTFSGVTAVAVAAAVIVIAIDDGQSVQSH